jgi:hypothetical protein
VDNCEVADNSLRTQHSEGHGLLIGNDPYDISTVLFDGWVRLTTERLQAGATESIANLGWESQQFDQTEFR